MAWRIRVSPLVSNLKNYAVTVHLNLHYHSKKVSVSRNLFQPICFNRTFRTTTFAGAETKPPPITPASRGSGLIFDFEEQAFDEEEDDDDGGKAKEKTIIGIRKSKEPLAKMVGDFGEPVVTEAKFKHKEHRYSTKDFHISPRKLTFLARQIAGKNVGDAINQMQFSPKKAAKKIMHSLCTARDHAWRYKMMDPKKLYIEQAWVGKGLYRKKIEYRARGRFNFLKIKKAHMKYIIKEAAEEGEGKPKKSWRTRRVKLKKYFIPLKDDKPIYAPAPFYNW
ncbi:hypothetical protein G9A89_023260 [Geosiphon pyriformis]|nr:hypothetical protein G9A89_023260 [Geosiphon pyriformis]